MTDSLRQPFLHRSIAAFHNSTQAWSPVDGQIRADDSLSGLFHSDVRLVSEAVVLVDGEEPEVLESGLRDASGATFLYAVRSIDELDPDPLVTLQRDRACEEGRVSETLTMRCQTLAPVQGVIQVVLASDLAGIDAVKSGRMVEPKTPNGSDSGVFGWHDAEISVQLITDSECVVTRNGGGLVLTWVVALEPGTSLTATWAVMADDSRAILAAPSRQSPEWPSYVPESGDHRLQHFVDTALGDLAALRSTLKGHSDDVILAGGIPWFQTLYGRDSIWAAQMLLPLTWEIAAGTLRTLALLQGTRVDKETAEQPGKILHEIRRTSGNDEQKAGLPPVYYGTIDATVLWIGLLYDAWQAGMPDDQVEALLPALELALAWIRDYGDSDGDGFIEYIDESGKGLANQGWKDSGDSVQFADGTLAVGPIALVEVQAYTFRALTVGAAILDAFGRTGGDEWRERAAMLRERFHEAFWLEDARGAYLAMALDGQKKPVDAVASNMGHVVGTGILDEAQIAIVADRLLGEDMFSGFGIRTLSTTAGRYWPLRYHGGTVWPHDSALIARNLALTGHQAEARRIADGLLDAATDFNYRLPELFAGYPKGTTPRAAPYPAACPVVCWSSACAITVANILTASNR